MSDYISVEFKAGAEAAAIISALLLDMGYEGAEETAEGMVVSIPAADFDEGALAAIVQPFGVDYTLERIARQNWNAQWESSFEPVEVGDFAMIRASFHEAKPGIEHDIIITPKMSFGTGHHATTYLMIALMQDMRFEHKVVIDFGTGTGVLAILAEKLGAAAVLAIDHDEWSINNSEENIAANDCRHIELVLADAMLHRQPADVILANINLNVILANLPAITEAAVPGGLVLFSGLMTADEETISGQLANHGFHIKKIVHKNGWIALLTSTTDLSPTLN